VVAIQMVKWSCKFLWVGFDPSRFAWLDRQLICTYHCTYISQLWTELICKEMLEQPTRDFKMLYWVGKSAKMEGEWTLHGHYAKCMSFAYILHSKHVISKKLMKLNTFILRKTKAKQIKIHSGAHIIVIEW